MEDPSWTKVELVGRMVGFNHTRGDNTSVAGLSKELRRRILVFRNILLLISRVGNLAGRSSKARSP